MKTESKIMCKVQEVVLEMKCPGCFSKEINLAECEVDEKNAACQSCGCTFKMNPAAIQNRWE
jgi:transcription initiation factor TFIIIB Brf1 subunit/transcription initiation factor TFIIB